jgi:hypothetical protein
VRQSTNLEHRSQIGNDVLNKIAHTLERWEQRLTLENPRLVEHYLEMELHVIVHLGVRFVHEKDFSSGHDREFALYSNNELTRLESFAEGGKAGIFFPEGIKDGVEGKTSIFGENRKQQTMLIADAQTVKFPEHVPLASTVRLEFADSLYSLIPKSLYFSERFGFVFRGVFGNREEGLVQFESGVPTEQQIGHVIQCGSQVLYDITYDCGNRIRQLLEIYEDIHGPSALRITIGSDFISGRLEICGDLDIEIRDVLFGPFNFYPHACKFGPCHKDNLQEDLLGSSE